MMSELLRERLSIFAQRHPVDIYGSLEYEAESGGETEYFAGSEINKEAAQSSKNS